MTTSIRASYARLALTAAANGDIRRYLCGILIEPRVEGGAFIVGCDGHRLLVIIDDKGVCDAPVIIAPDRSIQALLPKVGGRGDTDAAQLQLSEHAGKPALLATDRDGLPDRLQIKSPVVTGNYPAWRKVLPDFGNLKEGRMGVTRTQYITPFMSAINDKSGTYNTLEPFQEAPDRATVFRLPAHKNVLYLVMPVRSNDNSLHWINQWSTAAAIPAATTTEKAEPA